MFLGSIVRRIQEFLTHGSSPHVAAAAVDAHAAVARTAAAGLPIAVDRSGALAQLAFTVTPESVAAAGAATALGFVRSRALHGAADVLAVPDWARGMAIATTAGPFFDEHGLSTHIDTVFAIETHAAIVRAPGAAPIAYVHADSVIKQQLQGRTVLTFGAGSLWLVAPLLTKDAPPDGLAGLAISGATLSVHGALTEPATATVFTLAAGAMATLDVQPAAAPAVAKPGIDNDSAGAVTSLPANVRFELAPGATNVTALDDAALTAFATTAMFAGGPSGVGYDAELKDIAISYRAVTSPNDFTVTTRTSTSFVLRGSAPVRGGSYCIPVARTKASALGKASSGGALGLDLLAGMRAHWGNLTAPVRFATTLLRVETGALVVLAQTARRPFSDAYALWETAGPGRSERASNLTLHGSRGTLILALESAAGEVVAVIGCRVAGNLDRPLLASGVPPSLAHLAVTYTVIHEGPKTALMVEGAAAMAIDAKVRPDAYVIENAVVRTQGVDFLLAVCELAGGRAARGVVFIGNLFDLITPTLPDPYAAFLPGLHKAKPRTLIAIVQWDVPPSPQVAFSILPARAIPSFDASITTISEQSRATSGAALYDVSSRQNQFGVAASQAALLEAHISGQRLTVSGAQSALFSVPAIAWEPVLDLARTRFSVFSKDDGPPALAMVPVAELRPFEPEEFYNTFVSEYKTGDWNLVAELTLPFGLTAVVDTRPGSNTQPEIPRPTLLKVEPTFGPDRAGGKQLSIRAADDPDLGNAVLPGWSNAGSYAEEMLDDAPHTMAGFWNDNFGGKVEPKMQPQHFVPVSRYDLSGYGASTFSDYSDESGRTGIDRARFDVIVGRTLYELVEAQSFIVPWMIPVVNTTIFERDETGYVLRWNSGWRAKGPGEFAFDDPPAVELGGITGVYDVHNIVAQPGELTLATNPGKFLRVTFDANVQLVVPPATDALKVTGGDPSGHIPSSGLTGYLDIAGNDLPTLDQSIELLDTHGPVRGPLAAEVDVASTGIKLGLTGVEVVATRDDIDPRTLGVALRGTPRLPRDGAWSVATRPASTTVPQPLDPTTPVPLVRSTDNATAWRIADAADVVQLDDPLTFYGMLQATGANKVFFEHPVIQNTGANPLNFGNSPKLADVGKLLGDNGILPDIGSLLDFGAFDGIKAAGDGFALKTLTNTVKLDNRTLIPLGPIRLVMSTWKDAPGDASEITLELDPAIRPRWAITIKDVAFKLVIDGWGNDDDPLVTVHGTALAHEGAAPTLTDIKVAYGSALDVVKSVMTAIEQFTAFLPAKQKPGLDVSFVGSKLRIREMFPIPKLPLGCGFLEDISLELGFDVDVLDKQLSFFVSVGNDQFPFHWLVSPLSGNGMLQIGASDKMGVKMQAGIGLGLALDFAILSGSASIVIAVQLDATSYPIGVMVLLTGQASVDVLDGLTSASLTLTAGVGIKVDPGPLSLLTPIPPDVPDPIEFLKQSTVILSAEVAVGVHISVCWLVHVDFDAMWPFSETVSGKTLAALV